MTARPIPSIHQFGLCLLAILLEKLYRRRLRNNVSKRCSYLAKKGVIRRISRGLYQHNEQQPETEPKPGEVTLKKWAMDMASTEGVKPVAIHMRLSRGTMPQPPLRRVNQRVMFVRVGEE